MLFLSRSWLSIRVAGVSMKRFKADFIFFLLLLPKLLVLDADLEAGRERVKFQDSEHSLFGNWATMETIFLLSGARPFQWLSDKWTMGQIVHRGRKTDRLGKSSLPVGHNEFGSHKLKATFYAAHHLISLMVKNYVLCVCVCVCAHLITSTTPQ